MPAVLDHLAIATPTLEDGWDLFSGVLGGTWAYGGFSPGFRWGQLNYAAGPKIELLTPTTGPDAAFLERFLAAHGAGPHHFNFRVPDINDVLARIRAFGIEPVGVDLSSPYWKEAFLHPRDAHGIVIQVAQQAGSPHHPQQPRVGCCRACCGFEAKLLRPGDKWTEQQLIIRQDHQQHRTDGIEHRQDVALFQCQRSRR